MSFGALRGLYRWPTDSRPLAVEEHSPLVRLVDSGSYLLCFKGVPWTGSSQDLVVGQDVHNAQLSTYWP
jgi:hypothetical protein